MDTISSQQPGHSQITVTIAKSEYDLVNNFLVEHLSEGFQELDCDGSQVTLRFYSAESAVDQFREAWNSFYQNTFSAPAPEFAIEFIQEIDWQERFRRETKAVIIADSILVRPTWVERESVQAPSITTDIVIDPKMAFGVGSHETTKLAMCALKDTLKPGMRVADIGCGSLILSILAAKLGASYVKAVDNDPVAIENSRENCRLNGVSESVVIALSSTDVFSSEKGSYDIVVANIISKILLELLGDLVQLVSDSGTLILSGITKPDAPTIESALVGYGVTNWSQASDGEWVSYTCLLGAR
jgi:ribosomal protein L11 methyltransferase